MASAKLKIKLNVLLKSFKEVHINLMDNILFVMVLLLSECNINNIT